MTDFSEHEKLSKDREFHANISEFCEWLESQGYEIHKVAETQYNKTAVIYDTLRNEDVIAEFFGVDLKKFEQEKQEMLKLYGDSYDPNE